MPRQNAIREPKREPWALRCAKCGAENVHFETVVVDQGPKRQIIRRDGCTEIDKIRPNARGSSVEIHFWTECGHRFVQRFAFHKGSMYVNFELGDDLEDPYEAGADAFPGELWRD